MEGEYTLISPPSLKEALESFGTKQRNFLCFKAMGSDDGEARILASVPESTLRDWKSNELFLNAYNLTAAGDYRTAAIDIWLDAQLPTVLSQLMHIITSGTDGERASKDKEKAIEFYLKELCGYSRHVDKSISLAGMLVDIAKEKTHALE